MPALASELKSSHRFALNDCLISLAFSSDGTLLAVAEASGKVAIYDRFAGQRLHYFPAHSFGVTRLEFRPRTYVLATAGQDGVAHLWDASTGAQLGECNAGATWAEHVAWSPNGDFLATAAGKRLRLWSPSGEPLMEAPAHSSTIADIAWMPATARYPAPVLAYCGYGGLVFLKPASGNNAYKTFEYKGSMLKISWAPNALFIGTGNQDASMQFFVLPKGIDGDSKDLVMSGYRTKILDMAWDPKSRYLATGGSSTIVVWDCSGKGPAGTRPQLLDFHQRLLSELAWQSSGNYLASGCQEGLLALWHPTRSDRLLSTAHLGSAISQLRWSPDDSTLAASTEDGQLYLFPVKQ
jgi:WD40 repeat protein